MSALPRGLTVRKDAGLYGYERALRRAGLDPVAGVDEAGRGACAGPLVAAAVMPGLVGLGLVVVPLGGQDTDPPQSPSGTELVAMDRPDPSIDVEGALEPSAQTDLAHRGGLPVELLEPPAHLPTPSRAVPPVSS